VAVPEVARWGSRGSLAGMGNPVVHFELIGPDPARLRDFYSRLFGWNYPAGAPVAASISESTEYSFIAPADGAPPAAGGIGGGPGFAAHAIFYIGVSDVAEVLADAEALGAEVVLPPQRNEGGGVTVAHFRDPAGNLVGIAGPR
jgi:predicted enzyme related to lactoylglutathione lyase